MNCPCECNSGGFCGGCGHAGCSGGINLRGYGQRHRCDGCSGSVKENDMAETLTKPIVQLVGEDGNAFAILGRWQKAARKAGWPADRISKVVTQATSGSYDHLLNTIIENSEEGDE